MVEIIEYDNQYAAVFKQLNIEWLDKYNLTEPEDLRVLNNPRKEILEKGGHIWLAKYNNETAGSAALIFAGKGLYELAKMAVAPAFQGKGISRVLIEKCLAAAKELNAHKIILYSNSQLKTALSLYEKYGFKYVDATDSHFLTADIKMELSL